MSVTRIWEDPDPEMGYFIISHEKVWEDFGIDFRFIDKNGEEKHLKPIDKIYDVQRPLRQAHPMYLSKEELLRALSLSGVKEEEIERLKSKLYKSNPFSKLIEKIKKITNK